LIRIGLEIRGGTLALVNTSFEEDVPEMLVPILRG